MKRLIITLKRGVCGCCPGHDQYPAETYNGRTSLHARRRDRKKEQQHARALLKRQDQAALQEAQQP